MRQAGFTLIEILVALILIGVAAAAVVSLVANSSSSARDQASVAAQNSKVRSAMALIQRDLSEATKPIGAADSSISNGSPPPPAGKEIIFQRSQDLPDGRRIYYGERIAYNGPSATPALRNTITIQAVRSSTPFNMNAIDSPSTSNPPAPPGTSVRAQITNAPARVILDKVPTPDATNPLFAYYKNATTPAVLADSESIQLVDVNLRRDEDLDEGVSQAAALANQSFPTASLKTSVYLKRIGSQTEGRGSDVSC